MTTAARALKTPPQGIPGRPRDDIWDALVEVFGDPETSDERGRRNRVVKQLRGAGATPQMIGERVDAWPLLYEDATLTDLALAKHWTALGRPALRLDRAAAEQYRQDRNRDRHLADVREAMAKGKSIESAET
jgi:hypothetical protein